jgi:hypothetical protein
MGCPGSGSQNSHHKLTVGRDLENDGIIDGVNYFYSSTNISINDQNLFLPFRIMGLDRFEADNKTAAKMPLRSIEGKAILLQIQ